ncbi:MAG: hypothetical protein WAQ05_17035 [Rubrivivax sp.]
MNTRRDQLASEVERAAIDVQALSNRMAAADDLPLGICAQHGEALGKAARMLCFAAEVLHGRRTDALTLFFADPPTVKDRRAALADV